MKLQKWTESLPVCLLPLETPEMMEMARETGRRSWELTKETDVRTLTSGMLLLQQISQS